MSGERPSGGQPGTPGTGERDDQTLSPSVTSCVRGLGEQPPRGGCCIASGGGLRPRGSREVVGGPSRRPGEPPGVRSGRRQSDCCKLFAEAGIWWFALTSYCWSSLAGNEGEFLFEQPFGVYLGAIGISFFILLLFFFFFSMVRDGLGMDFLTGSLSLDFVDPAVCWSLAHGERRSVDFIS